ncbi:MAG: UDP-N-acetylmuramate:L-alanyl-gamma-D-glutamyl-meso-diaminopimelate ligase [Gammaproteobacteria bacterium]|nr:UDP-N-acetylmuramate:L-alanyl-gamma-D-glutamyl-meso-diaminopimelate ligase [Gammaproteobacteria bacterium]
MHIHILGIGGTFMAGLALLARAQGHRVTGSDRALYPPMSTQLAAHGIEVRDGYEAAHLTPAPDLVIIGNALTRGNAAVEQVLERGLRYTSGAQWLAEEVLAGRWVLAVAGTHGKTSTAGMLAWILEDAGLQPGFLIGGVPENFGVSARLGNEPFFVVEADEYDTAFFDKRSKFVHYRPRTLILNNLEYDHADIFPDLAAIQRQFHHLLRTVPGSGLVVVNAADRNLAEVLAMGCWSRVERFDAPDGFRAEPLDLDAGRFRVYWQGREQGEVRWPLIGRHNMLNALAAIGAARHAGVPVASALAALSGFRNVKRRLELIGEPRDGIKIYDDFAHHPSAIQATLAALRARVGGARIVAVLEPRSNTMRLGVHRATLAPALAAADRVVLFRPPDLGWDLGEVVTALGPDKARSFDSIDALVDGLAAELRANDQVLIMSNGGFGGLHGRLLARLALGK